MLTYRWYFENFQKRKSKILMLVTIHSTHQHHKSVTNINSENVDGHQKGYINVHDGPWNRIELCLLIPNWCLKILCDVTMPRFSSSNVGNSA